MIVTCPACQTRYLVDDADLGGERGRRVRCASCGNLWHYSPDRAAIQMAMADVTAMVEAAAVMSPTAVSAPVAPALRAEPGTQARPRPAGPTVLPRPSVAVEPAAARPRSATASLLVLIALLAALVLLAIIARDRIMAAWPSAAAVYAMLHLTQQSGAGLELTVTPTRTRDSFVVDGNIVNSGATPLPVPPLRITLRDGNKNDLDSRVVDPRVDQLGPGATAHFTTTFEHPSITAIGADVTFAPH